MSCLFLATEIVPTQAAPKVSAKPKTSWRSSSASADLESLRGVYTYPDTDSKPIPGAKTSTQSYKLFFTEQIVALNNLIHRVANEVSSGTLRPR